jgi:hypothetical protein
VIASGCTSVSGGNSKVKGSRKSQSEGAAEPRNSVSVPGTHSDSSIVLVGVVGIEGDGIDEIAC